MNGRHARTIAAALVLLWFICRPDAPCAEERTFTAERSPTAESYELQRKTETGKIWTKIGESMQPTWTYTPPAGKVTHFRICSVRGSEKACPKFWVVVNEK